MDLSGLRVGYVPNSHDLSAPGDRRRFVFYARQKGLDFEIARTDEDYDIVFIAPRGDIARWARYEGRAQLIYELIDSYMAPSQPLRNVLRGVGKYAIRELSRPTLDYQRAIASMARRANAVVCSTNDQQEALSRFCGNVHVILDFHEELGAQLKRGYRRGETFHLVWEGFPENLVGFEPIAQTLLQFSQQVPSCLHIVSTPSFHRYLGRVGRRETETLIRRLGLHQITRFHEWVPETLIKVATSADLALIPINLFDPFAAGKPENKLLSFWRLGVPSLVSATPAHIMVAHKAGTSDAVFSTLDDWAEGLSRYVFSEETRRNNGERGRAYVRRYHSPESLTAKWDQLFASLVG